MPAAGDFEVRYYAGVLWRGRYLVITAALVGLALGALVAHLQIPEYRAAAMVQIDPPTPLFMGVADAILFTGRLPQELTRRLLERADILVSPRGFHN